MKVEAALFAEQETRDALLLAYKLYLAGLSGLDKSLEVTRKVVRASQTRREVLKLFKAIRFPGQDVDLEELDKKLETQVNIIADHYGNYGDNLTQEQVEAHPVKDGCYLIPGKKKRLRKAPKSQVPRHYRWHEEFASAGIVIT